MSDGEQPGWQPFDPPHMASMLESKVFIFISSPQEREKERQWGTHNNLRENDTKLYTIIPAYILLARTQSYT